MPRKKRVDLQVFSLVTIGTNVIYCNSYTSDTLSQGTQTEIACKIIQEYSTKHHNDTSYYCVEIQSLDGHIYCNTSNNLTISFLFYPVSWMCKYSILKQPLIPHISTAIHHEMQSILHYQISTMNNNKIPAYILRIQCHHTFMNKSKALQNALSTAKRHYHCKLCTTRLKYCCMHFYQCAEPLLKGIAYILCLITCCWIPFAIRYAFTCCTAQYDRDSIINYELRADRRMQYDTHTATQYELTTRTSIELGAVRPNDPFSDDGAITITKQRPIPQSVTIIPQITFDHYVSTGTMQDTLKSFGAAQWGGGAPIIQPDYHYSDDEIDIKEIVPCDEYKIEDVLPKDASVISEIKVVQLRKDAAVDISKQMQTLLVDFTTKFKAWRAARQLVDNVFTDLENLFYLLAELVYKCEFKHFAEDMRVFVVIMINFVLMFVNVMVYVLIVMISLVIVLPSCFFLLIVRMNKVETDTVKLHQRAERLRQEVKCQRFCRLVHQFARASFMFGFLCIYPIIIVYVIIPSAGANDAVVMACIGSYLFTIIALQMFGTYRGIKSFEERKKLKALHVQYSPQKWKWNLGSIVAILLLFYEVFQLAIYSFHVIGDTETQDTDDTKWSADSLGLNSTKITNFTNGLTRICYLSIDFMDEYILEYYALFSIIFVGLLLLFFVMRFIYELREYARLKWKENDDKKAEEFYFHSFLGTIIYAHGTLKGVNKWSSKLISLLSDTFFLAIAQKVILIISCTTSSDNNKSYLRIDPDTVCWEGTHQIYATIALILLGYYIPICTMIAPIFAEDDDVEQETNEEQAQKTSKWKEFLSFSNTIQVVAPFMSALTVTECFMLISSEFVSRGGVYGTICSQAICMIALMVFTLNWSYNNLHLYGLTQNEPVFPFGVSMIRSLGFICGFIGCVIEIFRFHQFIDSALDILILMILIVVASVIIFATFWKSYTSFNSFNDDIDSNLMVIFDPNENSLEIGIIESDSINNNKLTIA